MYFIHNAIKIFESNMNFDHHPKDKVAFIAACLVLLIASSKFLGPVCTNAIGILLVTFLHMLMRYSWRQSCITSYRCIIYIEA